MKIRSLLTLGPSILLRASLLTVMLLISCAPVDMTTPVQPAAPMTETAQAPAPPAETEPPAAMAEAPATEAPMQPPQPIAITRGPDLEATDPTTVSLNSSELQLVEFFRFT